MYELWSMHWFGCWVLPPSTALLVGIAWWYRTDHASWENPATWIVQGALGGLLAALAYDLYRLIFVIRGAPLFKVFPRFGELLLGANEPRWLVHALGWTYHFSNGAALGIMFQALFPPSYRRNVFWGAVAWSLWVETMLLLTPYPKFFGLPFNLRFVVVTASAHFVFGTVLGWWCILRTRRVPIAGLESSPY